ncbi:MAG: gamma carbonic anhydrase family protein [Candidatus Dormibacteraeota bacterium]|uniref:Gamma carbonic anhydrase family protein n=1 Tax=Candidatus Dormiibacter inghamiae TaxID=3127013 RepID=A0A934N6I9_9BACT|nr:gamma carbonic anhydrase family protein [Candidatus Dormibacteraeota bacterium]MBJ7606004.1 gamma carbonic anhydrase family protein [Candidatus Dormibacteraeota bacterium]
MLLEHRGKRPHIHPSAYVAPTASICGDVTVGENTCILFGAVISAEGGSVTLGRECVVMENAVVRAAAAHPVVVGDHVLIGPGAYLSGCSVESEVFIATNASVFIATNASVFNHARLGSRSEVRINAMVHIRTVLPPDTTVPIGWVAIGDPAELLPPGEHDAIWERLRALDFPRTVWGLERAAPGETIMPQMTNRYTRSLRAHLEDRRAEQEAHE